MAVVEKRFKTVLTVPKVWKSLLEIQSFDDLTAFLEKKPSAEAIGPHGIVRPDWPRPILNDHREVCFTEDDYTVFLELISGKENYATLASVVLPTGQRYAHADLDFDVPPVEILEIPDLAKFIWKQQLI
jgi:hypothetical protein